MSKNQFNILIVDKIGQIENKNIRDFDEKNLYKKCGFKNDNNFCLLHKWILPINNIQSIKLFGKNKGRANYENQYEFPHPIKDLLFGSAAIVAYDSNEEIISLSKEQWDQAILYINQGFDNLDEMESEDEDEEDEANNYSPDKLTKHGYLKDDFIVDSDEDNGEEYLEGEIMEEEYQY